jgi:hypothetical protein
LLEATARSFSFDRKTVFDAANNKIHTSRGTYQCTTYLLPRKSKNLEIYYIGANLAITICSPIVSGEIESEPIEFPFKTTLLINKVIT